MRKYLSRSFWVLLIGGAIFIGMAARPARAGVAVSPLKQEMTIRPGEEGKYSVTIANNTRTEYDAAQSMHISIVDVQVAEDGSINFKDPGLLANSASKWVSISQTDLTLEPRTSQAIQFTVSPPLSAAPGEYYSAILVTLATRGRTDKGMTIQYRIASGIFVTIPGRTFPRQAKLNRVELLWPQIPAPGTEPPADIEQPKVSVTVQNTGQIRFEGTGKAALYDEHARMVFAGPLISKRPCVFGGDSRLFEMPITKTLLPGKYTIKVHMDYESTWATLRQEMSVDILPEQAELLKKLKTRSPNQTAFMEAGTEKLTPSIPAGASRSLALAIRNTADVPVHGVASIFATDGVSADSWITLGPTEMTISRSARKTVGVQINVPADTKPGKYISTITVEGGPEGSDPKMLMIPVEIEVTSEK